MEKPEQTPQEPVHTAPSDPESSSDEVIQNLRERQLELKEEIPSHEGDEREHLVDELERVEVILADLGVVGEQDPDLEK